MVYPPIETPAPHLGPLGTAPRPPSLVRKSMEDDAEWRAEKNITSGFYNHRREMIMNKLTSLLYGLDGRKGLEKQFKEDPENINLEQDDIKYLLSDSFSDFITNVSHKMECSTGTDNILWFIDTYVNVKDKLWEDLVIRNNGIIQELQEDNMRLKIKNDLTFDKPTQKRQPKKRIPYENQIIGNSHSSYIKKKNCAKCRGSICGVCVKHGG